MFDLFNHWHIITIACNDMHNVNIVVIGVV